MKTNTNPKEWLVSESFRRLNPHIYPALGPLEAYSAKPDQVSPLVVYPQDGGGGTRRVVARIYLVALRYQLLDPDAVAFACKPVTDAIAKSLGIDDADPRIEWFWTQAQIRDRNAEQGLIVRIQLL